MAYSSIGHMGFALVGLAAGTPEGVQGVIVYMAIYLAMTLGTFACILSMRRNGAAGRGDRRPFRASRARIPRWRSSSACMMFSLAGIPPLAGFFAKYFVFLAAIKAGLYVLAVIGVLASVVGAYYYLAIVKMMYFDEPAAPFEPMPRALKIVLGITGVFVILFFAYPSPLVGAAAAAAKSLVLMHLHPDADAAGVRLIAHDTLGSTNAEALARARAGERGPLWITAARQTAGRGRRGNVWTSEPGNLYASLLLTDAAPPAHLPELASWSALAVLDAVARAAPPLAPALKLKWPNDLLLDGAKLAGILIEAESVGGDRDGRSRDRGELRAPSRGPALSGDEPCGARRGGHAG